MKRVIVFVLSSGMLMAESITLEPIDVEEKALPSSEYVECQEDADKSYSITIQQRLERDVSFNTASDIVGEQALSFRGLDARSTSYVEDGIPLYRSVNGVVDTKLTGADTTLNLHDGSGTSTFGVSPMGGEVQIVQTKPQKGFESTLKTTLSNNDAYLYGYAGSRMDHVYVQADADVYYRKAFRLSDGYEPTPVQNKGKRVNSDRKQQRVSLKSGVYVGEHVHLAAKAGFLSSVYGLEPNVYTDLANPVWYAFSRIEDKKRGSLYLYGDYESELLTFNLRGYYDDYQDMYVIYDDVDYERSDPKVTYDDDRLGSVVTLKTERDRSETTLLFVAERNTHHRRGGTLADADYQSDLFKGSLIESWYIGASWYLDGALSYTLLQAREVSEQNSVIPPEDKKALDALLKTSYEDESVSLYASMAKKSRMPTMDEMFTFFPWVLSAPELKPEESLQGTLGYAQHLARKSKIDITAYYYDIKNIIIYRNNSFINREKAIHYGAEMRAETQMLPRQNLSLSYAYAYAVDSQEERLELIPEHQLKFEDTIALGNTVDAYFSYRYMGSRYSSNSATYSDEQLKIDGYHLVDVQMGYRPSEMIKGSVGIKNLLDEAYEWRYGYPAEGRSFYCTLEWTL